MAYIALYRKYRSQSFDELIGQQHITTVLQNAIRLGRIAHAYLFCGPRGCGKTSTARLLARAINCQKENGPTAEPCGVCDMCVRIRQGSAMDVVEMDAASETGIDDVREKIIENAKYAPGEARYKVYIIDEVHDLSLKAFDSLLKTIEEPPAHVVFILATTEIHKVPITVRSRCQRMDFKRGTLSDLIGNIKRVLDAESIPYEPEAVAAVARAAEGSFRDLLSLLEQALAYTDGTLTAESVHASVGTVGPELLDQVTRVLATDDMQEAFLKAGELVESGKDVKQTLIALQLHLRDLLVAGAANSHQALADVSAERFAQLKEQARWFTPPQLLRMLGILADTERDLRFSNQHRLLLERAFWSVLPSCMGNAPAQPMEVAPVPRALPAAGVKPVPQPERAPEPPPVTEIRPQPRPMEPSTATAVPPAASAPSTPPLVATGAPEPPDEPGDNNRFAEALNIEGIRRSWPRVMRRLTNDYKAASGIFTDEVQVQELDGKFVVLGFPNEFQRGRADRPKAREALEKVLATEMGILGLKVRCVMAGEAAVTPASPVEIAPAMLDLPPDPNPPPASNGYIGAYDDLPAPALPQTAVVSSSPVEVQRSAADEEEEAFFLEVMTELDCRPADD